jgi:UDP-2,3-diacylglucosamine pyrophosphatase LpxH
MQAGLSFEQVHVISDLHLGGRPGFQIFGSTAELAAVINMLAAPARGGKLALVINGDFVDFLAEEPSGYFDPEFGVAKLDRIAADPTFSPVFDALRVFSNTPERTLVVNLGNHDLELALPWVREHLTVMLSGGQPEARGRIMVVTDGSGFTCSVGPASVLCIHGNEVDSWNTTDFETVRRIGRDLQFGNAIEPWIPNAGTQMVIDVMNSVKREFPFVDLLKPEQEAVIPTLLALKPATKEKLRAIVAALGRRAHDSLRLKMGFLGEVRDTHDGHSFSAPSAHLFDSARDIESAAQFMDRVEEEARLGTEPMDLVRGSEAQQLGFWSAASNMVRGRSRIEVLREALEKLDSDRSFDPLAGDSTFDRIDALVSPEIDFVVAGHTHLERALKRKRGAGWYFNSGTWARLIRITPEIRQDALRFAQVFALFRGGTMAALDLEPNLVEKRCSVVSICMDGPARVHGELSHALLNPSVTFQAVSDTRFSKEA